MTDGVVALTNQAVVAILVGCGGIGLVGLIVLVGWLQRSATPPASGEAPKKRPHPLTVVFTRRARSHEEDEGS